MLKRLLGFDEGAMLELLATEYGYSGAVLEFAPLGEDSWSYRAGDLWVSVRRDLRGHVPAAYSAATELREQGVEFVLAPLRGASGSVVHRVDGLPVVVLPYVESISLESVVASSGERRRVVEMLSELHEAELETPLSDETFDLSFAPELELIERIANGAAPAGGRYSAPLGNLLRTHRKRLGEWWDEYEMLADHCREQGFQPRVTHGEPLASNVLRTPDGLMLADWGELMYAPVERDWSHVRRTLREPPRCEPDLLRLYDLRWQLSEVGEYASTFAGIHAGNADDAAMWERLTHYLPHNSAAVERVAG